MRSIEVEVADVYRNTEKVGKLERTSLGCRFSYLETYSGMPIAFHLPLGEPLELVGDNLPPFFANLLPEGARLQALIHRARTSASDMFSLLIEAGPECVGDVYVLPSGTDRKEIRYPSQKILTKLDFTEVLGEVMDGADDAAIPGVQDKLSISDSTINIPLSSGASSAILKLSPSNFPGLVENEAHFLLLAKQCGFKVPSFKVVTDRTGRSGLLVTRFDRLKTANVLSRIHQEDGCQMLDKYPSEKYRISMRSIIDSIQEYSSAAIPETLEILMRYVFSYLIGNADLHAKNISLKQNPVSLFTGLTPIYDVVCTLLYRRLEQRMALAIDGKDNRFRVADLIGFGEKYGVRSETFANEIRKLVSKIEPAIENLSSLPFDAKDIERAQKVMTIRLAELKG